LVFENALWNIFSTRRIMHLIIEGDDILIYGCGSDYIADHDANLRRLLERVRESNLKLNKKKL